MTKSTCRLADLHEQPERPIPLHRWPNRRDGSRKCQRGSGLFDTYSEIGHRAYTIFRSNMWEGFGQDSWKVKQKLTINFGLRYTVIVPYHALWGNMIVFDPKFLRPEHCGDDRPQDRPHHRLADRSSTLQWHGHSRERIPSSAKGRVPRLIPVCTPACSRSSNHYSDIQWGEIQPRMGSLPAQQQDCDSRRRWPLLYPPGCERLDLPWRKSTVPTQRQRLSGSVDNPGVGGAASIPLVVTTQSKAFKNPEAWAWNFTFEREMFLEDAPERGLRRAAWFAPATRS